MNSLSLANHRPAPRKSAITLAAFIATLAAPHAQAASNSWATTTSGNWNDPASWTGGSIIPGNTSAGATATADVATFGTSGSKTITLDTGRTVGGISFNGAGTTNIGTSATTNTLYLSNGGTIQMTAGGSALNFNTKLVISGANADYTIKNSSSTSGGSIQFNGTISGGTAGATVLTLDGTNTNTFNRLNGAINNGSSTSLAVVKNGTGLWALRASNSFSGGLTLNAGTLSIGNAGALGTGAITIYGGSIDGTVVNSRSNTQNWNGNFTFVGSGNLDLGTGAVTMNATRTITTNANTLTVGGAIGDGGGAFGLTKAGAGTLALGGANTYSGGTIVSAGTLATLSTGGTFGTGGVNLVSASSMLTFGNSTSIADSASLSFISTMGAGSINLNFAGTETLAGIYKTDGTPASIVSGLFTAAELNSYFGTTIFTGSGSLQFGAIPEPSSYAAILGGLALVGVAATRRR